MQRIAEALTRVLAVAALPVLVVGCSGSSDDSGSPASESTSAAPTVSAAPSPTLAAARFKELPNPCTTLAKRTVQRLVPKSKDASGDAARTPDANARASCSWNGLDDYQYRWLDVSLQRTDSLPGVGSAEDQAKAAYTKAKAASVQLEGLPDGKRPTVRSAGLGDESQLVSAKVTKDKEEYRDVTVLVRSANVLVTVSYDGAGFQGDDTPPATSLEKAATSAAREVLGQID